MVQALIKPNIRLEKVMWPSK